MHDISAISLSKFLHENSNISDRPGKVLSSQLNEVSTRIVNNLSQFDYFSIGEEVLDPSVPDLIAVGPFAATVSLHF